MTTATTKKPARKPAAHAPKKPKAHPVAHAAHKENPAAEAKHIEKPAVQQEAPAPEAHTHKVAHGKNFYAVGRRKTAVAQVIITAGNGAIKIGRASCRERV